jgi:two-component sensor histidine kinase
MDFNFYRKKPFIYTLISFLFCFSLWLFVDNWQINRLISDKEIEILHDIRIHGNTLAMAINRKFALLESLKAFTLAELDTNEEIDADRFFLFASSFFDNEKGIRNMVIAPKGINEFVYPLRGNEAALGHDLLNDKRPEVRADVNEAISTGRITLSGPYELRQGGLGVVARLAISSNGHFWGFVAMVIDMPSIISESDMDHLQEHVRFALYNDTGFVFYGDESVLKDKPIILSVKLPDGEWHIAGLLLNSWREFVWKERLVFRFFELIFVILISLIVYLILTKQAFLVQQIDKRTLELQTETNELGKMNKLLGINENRLLELVSQKEYLMKELQHRVKNNLNVISSFLNLEIANLSDDNSRNIFNNARNRIESISSIYEQLYMSADLINIDFHIYIKNLALTIFETYNFDSEQITLTTDLTEIQLNADKAIPLGLILNELISNVLKYAFPDDRKGEMFISLRRDHDQVILSVKDDGIGLSPDFNFKMSESMGMVLIRMLTEQIGGEISIKKKNGTEFSIIFED